MLKLFEKSKLYKFDQEDYRKVIHNEPIAADLIILLKMEIDLQPELIEMLDKMTAALKLNKDKFEYLVFNNTVTLSQIAQVYQCKKILVFGAEPDELNLNMELAKYENYTFQNFQLLWVNNIIDVYGNQALKTKLWNSLKAMFE